MKAVLTLNSYTCLVRLGCEAQERSIPQAVSFTVSFAFPDIPKACQTDNLEDTICYADACESIRKVAECKEYRLVEHLADEVFRSLRSLVNSKVKITLLTKKVNPPVEGLSGGAHFELTEI